MICGICSSVISFFVCLMVQFQRVQLHCNTGPIVIGYY